MNQKKKIENYQQIAMGTGLRYDETNDLLMKWVACFMGNGMGLTLSSMHPMQDIHI